MGGIFMALRSAGWSLECIAAAMFPALLRDLSSGQLEWRVFGFCALLVAFVGAAMILSCRGQCENDDFDAELRPVILSLLLSSICVIAAASLPFIFGQTDCSGIDAVFEATSQLTTTGVTIFPRLSDLSSGMVLWRGTLQWIGGAGALVLGIALLPFLQVGGMASFKMDVFAGLESTQRAKRVALSFGGLYATLTIAIAALLWAAGLTPIDALIHAMGVISTGGATTWNSSLGHYDLASVDVIAVLGMIIAGLPFPLLLAASRGHFKPLLGDVQVRWYLGILLCASVLLTWWGMRHWGLPIKPAALNDTLTVVSTVTGTGYVIQPSLFWSGFPAIVMLFLTTVGGCSGSTTGGLKVFRLQAVFSEIWVQMAVLLRPHSIRASNRDGWIIYRAIRTQIMGYVFIYTMSFVALSWGLGALGMDTLTALTASVSALANADLRLGAYLGYSGGYGNLPDAAKIILAAAMMIGRLEILPVLVIFTTTFWRR
jgi:trk system potassium uptake protein TrkH